ncbi:MAG TPA: hypothetical protein VGM01_08565 [Ktedonobacteraceae bacterium]|jgi:hypothetical protein
MQYPPREPESQPYYAPSEIYQYEPVSEGTRLSAQSQEIVVYANRGQAIMRTAICVVCLLVILLIVPATIMLGAQTGAPFEADELVSLIVVIPGAILIGWLTWRIASATLFNRESILVINREACCDEVIPCLGYQRLSFRKFTRINQLKRSCNSCIICTRKN